MCNMTSAKSKVANVSIEINEVNTLFRLQVHFKEVPRIHRGDLLHRRDVTRYLGMYLWGDFNTVSRI